MNGPLESPQVELSLSQPYDIHATVELEKLLEQPEWKLILEGRGINLSALVPDAPKIDLATLNAEISGSNSDYRGTIRAVGSYGEFDGIKLGGDFVSDQGGIELPSFRLQREDGIIQADDWRISWEKQLSWSGDVSLKNFNSALLHHDFPGKLSGSFSGVGHQEADFVAGYLKLHQISGVLRGSKISGGGEIGISDKTLQTRGLALKIGRSELILKGQAGDIFALNFSIFSPDIGEFLPQGSGEVDLKGSLTGDPGEPLVDVKLNATGFSYRNNRIADLETQFHFEQQNGGTLNGIVHAGKVALAGAALDEVNLELSGTLDNHQLIVALSNELGSLQGNFSGGYQESWAGELLALQLKSAEYGSWNQLNSAAVKLDSGRVNIADFCLREQRGTFCFDGGLQLDGAYPWILKSSLDSVPLDWLNRLKLVSIPLNGMIQARVTAQGDGQGVQEASLGLNSETVDLETSFIKEELGDIHFSDTLLQLDLQDQLLTGDFSTYLRTGIEKNRSRLELELELGNLGEFKLPQPSLIPLDARFELHDFDLALLAVFTSSSVDLSGKVDSSLEFTGTVAQPNILGETTLRKGGIALYNQGITLKDVSLSLDARMDEATVQCKATSGPGQLLAAGRLRYGGAKANRKDEGQGLPGFSGDLHLEGENFELFNLPEYIIQITPDVSFKFSSEKGELEGTLGIPFGRITPENLNAAITASEDVILIDGTPDVNPETGWPFYANLEVRPGKDVRLDGYGLVGRLEGALNLKVAPETFPSGQGELDLVEGSFTIYGRSLDISRGRVLFTGGPLDNPGIDVRAQKKVSDEEAKGKGYTAGGDISGLVQDLKFRLFSDPFMDDTEILSQMFIGHSLNNFSGEEGSLLKSVAVALGLDGSTDIVGKLGDFIQLDDLHLEGSSKKEDVSLVVGKRVSRKLYIGYDMNMFSKMGQFRVNYDLDRGFFIETRSSVESTAVDFFYSFER